MYVFGGMRALVAFVALANAQDLFLSPQASVGPSSHKITNIPGYGAPATPQYAGLINVSLSLGTMHYHYWLVTSSSPTAASDPVVFWFQGGPGANGIAYGLLTENGPYYLDEDAKFPTLKENPYPWHSVANMVWVEHPPGVGFSYCGSNPKYDACDWDDDTQAVAAYNFIKEFFQVFPSYAKNDVFVTGESYGGMYVPTIVEQIHNNGGVNLKGFAIGNGVIGNEDTYPGSAGAQTRFLHDKAFISEALWEKLMEACGWDFSKSSAECRELRDQASDEAGQYYIYNVYDACGDDHVNEKTWLKTTAKWDSDVAATQRIGAPDDYPCGTEKLAVRWLNLPEVRETLHAPPESFYGYKVGLYPGGKWNYQSSRAHLLNIYPTIAAAYRTLIYNGDFDACVPYIGMEAWTRSLGFRVKENWRPWTVMNQVAGYVTTYDHNNFMTATVKGSGHMVPQYKGREALAMLTRFLEGQAL